MRKFRYRNISTRSDGMILTFSIKTRFYCFLTKINQSFLIWIQKKILTFISRTRELLDCIEGIARRRRARGTIGIGRRGGAGQLVVGVKFVRRAESSGIRTDKRL